MMGRTVREAAMKDNPDYKGEWKARRISDLEYRVVNLEWQNCELWAKDFLEWGLWIWNVVEYRMGDWGCGPQRGFADMESQWCY